MDKNKPNNKNNRKRQVRKSSGSKSKQKKVPVQPKQPSQRQNRLIETAEAAKAAKEKAHKIVLGLIEDTCDPQLFVEQCRYIDPDLYEDVVTERSIAETCGYPLCHNTFKDSYGNRTYVIRHNSVYDITNRRNFCSDVCYEASEIVKKQISSTPLYLRGEEEEELSPITIPNSSTLKGIPGKYVNIKGPVLELEDDDILEEQDTRRKMRSKVPEGLTVNDVAHSGLINCAENSTQLEDFSDKVKSDGRTKTEIEKTNGTKVDKVDTFNSDSKTYDLDSKKDAQKCVDSSAKDFNKSKSSGYHSHTAEIKPAHNGSKTENKDKIDKSKGVEKAKNVMVDPLAEVREVEVCLREWMNFESLRFILGDLYVRGMLEAFGQQWEDYDSTAGLRLGMEAKAKYIALCRRLDREDQEDMLEMQQSSRTEKPTGTMPDQEQLTRDARNKKLKVRAFYSGQEEFEDSESEEENQLETIAEEEEGTDIEKHSTVKSKKVQKREMVEEMDNPALPLIDSYSQMAWRRTVVMEKLNTVLSDTLLVVQMRECYSEIHSLIKELVSLYDLAAHNIMMSPAQWTLVVLAMLKMLSVRYQEIDQGLKSEESSKGIKLILQKYGLDSGYLDRLLSYLTEIQYIISKYHKMDKYDDHQNCVENDVNSHSVHDPFAQKSTDLDVVCIENQSSKQVSTHEIKKLLANDWGLPELHKIETRLIDRNRQDVPTKLDQSGHRLAKEGVMIQNQVTDVSSMMQGMSLQEKDQKEDPYSDMPPLEEPYDPPVHCKYTNIEELD